jgi:tetratricopeptide (TPR) repeat protein
MEPGNPVIRLCVAGMQAEGRGDFELAHALFAEAWEKARDNYERCIAAHYLARHQVTPQNTLQWNEASLQFAEAVGDARVAAFYPSLLLNLGQAHEQLGNSAQAKRYYDLAAAQAERLPEDRYGRIVRDGAAAGQRRLSDEAQCA